MPAPILRIDIEPRRHRRWRHLIAQIAGRTGHSGRAAAAGMVPQPRLVVMGFTDPATILASEAIHCAILSRLLATAEIPRPSGFTSGFLERLLAGQRLRSRPPAGDVVPVQKLRRTTVEKTS